MAIFWFTSAISMKVYLQLLSYALALHIKPFFFLYSSRFNDLFGAVPMELPLVALPIVAFGAKGAVAV